MAEEWGGSAGQYGTSTSLVKVNKIVTCHLKIHLFVWVLMQMLNFMTMYSSTDFNGATQINNVKHICRSLKDQGPSK